MPEIKLISIKTIKIQMAGIISALWKIAMMQRETALSVHANSTDVATTGVLSAICPLATR